MNQIPYNMNNNFSYQCPMTGKTFEFSRDKASKNEAFAQQQVHTGGEIQRLERLAGRQLSFRELVRSSRVEREQAAASAKAEATAAEEAAKKPQGVHPLVEAILGCSSDHSVIRDVCS